jgi:ATP-dependent DNA ligase
MTAIVPEESQSPIVPMEALLVDALPDGAGWIYEPKWDGFRCIVAKSHGHVALFAKSGKPLHRYFPEVVAALADLPADRFVLDGELVLPTPEGLSFDALQLRLHPAESRIRKLAGETPALVVLFDLLMGEDGADWQQRPFLERRSALEDFYARYSSRVLRLSPLTHDSATARAWLDQSGSGTDGVVAKRLDASYQPGERVMLKVKNRRTADCVVGGFRYAKDSTVVGSLLLGLYDANGLLDHVGFTSAFAKENKADLTHRLESMKGEGFTGNAPGGPSRWSTDREREYVPVRPELVVEISYDHITGHRFRHGTALERWRPDKAPRQCTFEQLAPATVLPAVRAALSYGRLK